MHVIPSNELMIRQRNKKTVSWLLIVAMLHLMLITSGGMVMASPQMDGELMPVQSTSSDSSDCDHMIELAPIETATECDSCQESTCLSSCSTCMQTSLFILTYELHTTPATEAFSDSTPLKLASLGYTPIPRPPSRLHS